MNDDNFDLFRRVSCERDSLLEQVKTNREKKLCDTVGLEQKVEDVENRARLLENERRDLLMTCSDLKTQLEATQEENHNFEIKLAELEIDKSQLKADLDELRVVRSQVRYSKEFTLCFVYKRTFLYIFMSDGASSPRRCSSSICFTI